MQLCSTADVDGTGTGIPEKLPARVLQGTPYHILTESDYLQTIPIHRNAHNDPNRRWSKRTVPFIVSDKFSESQRASIVAAQREIEDGTCVRFRPRTDETDYIEYVSDHEGCNALVGRQGGRQEVNLEVPECVEHGTIVHETLHALGFNHEQTRSDRDDYIIVKLDNILPTRQHNYEKEQTNNLKTPYDFTSIMHYDTTYFAVDLKLPTMVSREAGRKIAPNKDHMSAIDKWRVNVLYQCDGPDYVIDTLKDLTAGCTLMVRAVPAGNTCTELANACGLSLKTIYAINPKLQNGTRCKEKLPADAPICCQVGPSKKNPTATVGKVDRLPMFSPLDGEASSINEDGNLFGQDEDSKAQPKVDRDSTSSVAVLGA
ncbi:putative High choriolytic enzyme 1 [Hypsibius exemplaris]|uniref:Metalloendopeptidase n=1 Tax=Hypsibius exemplaris TaxID=2072580 RepID=A0A1W0WWW4_HYPEX|nr:putative High choriolytic enzyme 1 [Hypsibius exemplaris]